jgi:signal transduction histidine kinase
VRDKIFEKFYRLDNTDRRTIGGTGLGLALVREIVTAHSGRVWVESAEGQGSTFYISLPAVKEAQGEETDG